MNNLTQPLFDLTGRVAVVTGASSGIGQAIAGFLAKAGARVLLVARRRDRLDQTVTAIEAAGGEAAAVGGDLAERDQILDIASKSGRFWVTLTSWLTRPALICAKWLRMLQRIAGIRPSSSICRRRFSLPASWLRG